jgi:hypothetical protein
MEGKQKRADQWEDSIGDGNSLPLLGRRRQLRNSDWKHPFFCLAAAASSYRENTAVNRPMQKCDRSAELVGVLLEQSKYLEGKEHGFDAFGGHVRSCLVLLPRVGRAFQKRCQRDSGRRN